MVIEGSPFYWRWAAVGTLTVLLWALVSPQNIWAQSGDHTTVNFDDITFDVPGQGWRRDSGTTDQHGDPQIRFTRKLGGNLGQSLTLSPVKLDPPDQEFSPQKISSKYFSVIKFLAFAHPTGETGFREGEHIFGSRLCQTMSFQVGVSNPEVTVDGLFVLYFPDDYRIRRKFYQFIWLDSHPSSEPGGDLEMLEAIISSVKVKQ